MNQIPKIPMDSEVSQLCPACLNLCSSDFARTSNGFNGVKCKSCGLVWTKPMPDDETLRKFYQGFDFEQPNVSDVPKILPAITKSLEHFVGKADDNEEQEFLDFGGASGIYCVAAKHLGYKTYLFDFDDNMINFARYQFGLERSTSDLSRIPTNTFDVVFCFHVIEHCNDLETFLDTARSFLKPGGKFVLATPAADSLEKYVRPQHLAYYWVKALKSKMSLINATRLILSHDSIFCWDPPRHLFAFTSKSMRVLFERKGWEVDIIRGYNCDPIFEPRQYVMPAIRSLFASKHKRPLLNAVSRIGMQGLRKLFPREGEQLYCIATPK